MPTDYLPAADPIQPAPTPRPVTGINCWLDRKQPNALNLMRLVFASAVIVNHAWFLRGALDPLERAVGNHVSLGTISVNFFFLISGYLIVASWQNRRTAEGFMRARMVRIWPGFLAACAFTILVATIAAWDQWRTYLSSLKIQGAITGAATLNHAFMNTPSAFATSFRPGSANGSLWTIPREFNCYLAVALVGSIGLFSRRFLALGFAAFATCVVVFEMARTGGGAHTSWARFACYFAVGSVVYLYRDLIPRSGILAAASAVGIVLAAQVPYGLAIALPFLGAYLVFYVAFTLPDAVKGIGSKNDISYGVYLYASPVQQLYYSLVGRGVLPDSPVINAAVTILVAFGLGWLSWKLIEQPSMRAFR